jgi:hypothetical protein
MTADTQAGWSTMRADRRFLWFWLCVATLLSVAGNVGHAWLTVGEGATRWMAIGWASAPPALLMLAIHGLPTLARMLGSVERDRLLTVVVWGVTIGAFGWSAFGIFGFTVAMGIPHEIAWVAPLVIDLSVFGATRGLVLTAPAAARMRAGVAVANSASVELDSRPQAAVPFLPEVPSPAVAVSNPVVPQRGSDSAQSAVDEPSTALPTPGLSAGTRPARERAVSSAACTQIGSARAETVAVARQIVASGAVRKPVETVAAILSAAEGESRKAVIAEQVGVHHSVVTKTLDAAESHRGGRLAAVG